MPLTFNIIYTPGTVHHLAIFVHSLLRWSDGSFCLVANGCTAAEQESLQTFCRDQPRLSYIALPTIESCTHSTALNYLQERNDTPYFCFLDSDIFATGPFLPPFTALLQQHVGIFSCASLWLTAEEQVLGQRNPFMSGEYRVTEQGLCIGSSYFAIYHNPTITALRQNTGISFQRYQWAEIPPAYQARLIALGVRKQYYDTGKLLNLLLLDQGHPLTFVETDLLTHLGGYSLFHKHYQRSPWRYFGYRLLRNGYNRLVRNTAYQRRQHLSFLPRRHLCASYFRALLMALIENQPLPPLPAIDNADVKQAVSRATQEIQMLYQTAKGPGY